MRLPIFKRELLARNEATPLFGNLRGEALEGILASLEQTMFGDSLYRSREEKAAHLLYFIVKDHPFTDGNKRIGSFLFLLYLQQEGVPHRLTPEGSVEKSRQRRSRHFSVLTYYAYAPRVKQGRSPAGYAKPFAALLDGLF